MAGEEAPSSCANCLLRGPADRQGPGAGALAQLDRLRRRRVLQPGELLYGQGDPCRGVYCIRRGLVGERRVDAEGRSTLIRLCQPGSMVGWQELVSATPYRNSAEILQESHVCFVPASAVRTLIAASPALRDGLLLRAIADARQLEDALAEAKTVGVKGRLLHVLLILHEQAGGEDTGDGRAFHIPLARRDLAALVGATPETISRIVRRLEEQGIAHFKGDRVTIPDFAAVVEEISASA